MYPLKLLSVRPLNPRAFDQDDLEARINCIVNGLENKGRMEFYDTIQDLIDKKEIFCQIISEVARRRGPDTAAEDFQKIVWQISEIVEYVRPPGESYLFILQAFWGQSCNQRGDILATYARLLSKLEYPDPDAWVYITDCCLEIDDRFEIQRVLLNLPGRLVEARVVEHSIWERVLDACRRCCDDKASFAAETAALMKSAKVTDVGPWESLLNIADDADPVHLAGVVVTIGDALGGGDVRSPLLWEHLVKLVSRMIEWDDRERASRNIAKNLAVVLTGKKVRKRDLGAFQGVWQHLCDVALKAPPERQTRHLAAVLRRMAQARCVRQAAFEHAMDRLLRDVVGADAVSSNWTALGQSNCGQLMASSVLRFGEANPYRPVYQAMLKQAIERGKLVVEEIPGVKKYREALMGIVTDIRWDVLINPALRPSKMLFNYSSVCTAVGEWGKSIADIARHLLGSTGRRGERVMGQYLVPLILKLAPEQMNDVARNLSSVTGKKVLLRWAESFNQEESLSSGYRLLGNLITARYQLRDDIVRMADDLQTALWAHQIKDLASRFAQKRKNLEEELKNVDRHGGLFRIGLLDESDVASLKIGEEVACCLSPGGKNFKHLIHRIVDPAWCPVVASDFKGTPVAVCWGVICREGCDTVLAVDFTDAKPSYGKDDAARKLRDTILEQMIGYAKELGVALGVRRLHVARQRYGRLADAKVLSQGPFLEKELALFDVRFGPRDKGRSAYADNVGKDDAWYTTVELSSAPR